MVHKVVISDSDQPVTEDQLQSQSPVYCMQVQVCELCRHACVRVCVCAHAHAHSCVCVCVCVQACVCVCVCVNT